MSDDLRAAIEAYAEASNARVVAHQEGEEAQRQAKLTAQPFLEAWAAAQHQERDRFRELVAAIEAERE